MTILPRLFAVLAALLVASPAWADQQRISLTAPGGFLPGAELSYDLGTPASGSCGVSAAGAQCHFDIDQSHPARLHDQALGDLAITQLVQMLANPFNASTTTQTKLSDSSQSHFQSS